MTSGSSTVIRRVDVVPRRFRLPPGVGADAVHRDPEYAYAVTLLQTDTAHVGCGLAFTLGQGTELVCEAAAALAAPLVGREIESVMAEFGRISRAMADHPQLRWLGPHKGVVHLALASVTNACFDLWAKARGVPLWHLLLELSDDAFVALLDLSYLEDVLTSDEARSLLATHRATRDGRTGVLREGYPGYDTSIGWIDYDDAVVRENAIAAVGEGFTALKLKVGSPDPSRDLRRAFLLREVVGPDVRLMLDANQKWSVPEALTIGAALSPMAPFWLEEPTHPDDVLGHQTLARALAPVRIAAGEHVPNRVVFKNLLQCGAVAFNQVDAVRVAGVSEFLTISLMSRKFGVPVVPHVGDMGQLHQHLVLVNHVAMDHEQIFLEYIPHLREYFSDPAVVSAGRYRVPMAPGASSDLLPR